MCIIISNFRPIRKTKIKRSQCLRIYKIKIKVVSSRTNEKQARNLRDTHLESGYEQDPKLS